MLSANRKSEAGSGHSSVTLRRGQVGVWEHVGRSQAFPSCGDAGSGRGALTGERGDTQNEGMWDTCIHTCAHMSAGPAHEQ